MLYCTKDAVLTHLVFDADTGGDRPVVTVLRGVSWYARHTAAADIGGLHAAQLVQCRIPAGVQGRYPLPVPGDTMTCDGMTVTVVDVHDNRGRAIPHVYVEGRG